jgi:hypothetical protein
MLSHPFGTPAARFDPAGTIIGGHEGLVEV